MVGMLVCVALSVQYNDDQAIGGTLMEVATYCGALVVDECV